MSIRHRSAGFLDLRSSANRVLLVALLGSAAVLFTLVWRPRVSAPVEEPAPLKSVLPEAAPLCPWRNPEEDLRALFPQADSWQEETRILSGLRVVLRQRLGRFPAPEENALRWSRVYRGAEWVGLITTQRVKGKFGAIELVLAVGTDGTVRGLRLQRWREPAAVAEALQQPAWLGAFVGKRLQDNFLLGTGLPQVAVEARSSAAAIAEGVWSLLVLIDAAGSAAAPVQARHH